MTLARTVQIVRYVGVCEDHPSWVAPSYNDKGTVDRLVHEHNEAEHEGVETND
jgi:hypothetical protein